MKIYTKIFIGMALGVVVGFTLGPNAALLPKDVVFLQDPGKLTLLVGPGGAERGIQFPDKKKGVPALKLKILEQRPHGDTTYFRVQLAIKKELLVFMGRDQRSRIYGADRAKPGKLVEGWVDSRSLPKPISSFGQMVISVLSPVGELFLKLIKMVIVPLVFASLLVGVASLGDIRKLGRLGGKTLGYFLLTTTLAITIGLTLANLIKPGNFISGEDKAYLKSQYEGAAQAKVKSAAEQPSAVENLLAIVPDNPIKSMARGDMLQIIFFAAFFGVALTLLPDKRSKPILKVMEGVNDAMIICVEIIMKLAPYGVFALLAKVIGESGLSVLKALLVYSLVVMGGLLLHSLAVYTSVVRLFGKISARDFWKAIRPAQLIAFSTSSSSATLPVTLDCAQQRLGISREISSFVLPLGSTVNMDGTALYQGVAAIFIAQVFGIDLSLGDQLTVVLTATLASVGAAGVPGVGMVTLALVLTSIGVPTVGVALILGVDRILDMFRTAVNVTGDMSAAVMVAATEGETITFTDAQPDDHDHQHGHGVHADNTEEN